MPTTIAAPGALNPTGLSIAFMLPGQPLANALVGRYIFPRAGTLASNFPSCYAGCDIAPTLSYTIGITKNGVSIGTITFASGAQVGTFSGAGASVVAGDILELTGQSTTDATISSISVTFQGTF